MFSTGRVYVVDKTGRLLYLSRDGGPARIVEAEAVMRMRTDATYMAYTLANGRLRYLAHNADTAQEIQTRSVGSNSNPPLDVRNGYAYLTGRIDRESVVEKVNLRTATVEAVWTLGSSGAAQSLKAAGENELYGSLESGLFRLKDRVVTQLLRDGKVNVLHVDDRYVYARTVANQLIRVAREARDATLASQEILREGLPQALTFHEGRVYWMVREDVETMAIDGTDYVQNRKFVYAISPSIWGLAGTPVAIDDNTIVVATEVESETDALLMRGTVCGCVLP